MIAEFIQFIFDGFSVGFDVEMLFTKNTKITPTLSVVVIIVIAPIVLLSFMNQTPPENEGDNIPEPPELLEVPVDFVNITIFETSGAMIEANNIRIYVDPYELPSGIYSEYPADLVLITHNHIDHYSLEDIRLVEKNDTLVVFPESMAYNFHLHNNSLGLEAGDSIEYRGINVTAFYDGWSATTKPNGIRQRAFFPFDMPADLNNRAQGAHT